MPQPTTYPYHYIGKIQPLVKKTTTSPSNRFEMRWKWEDQILQEATTRMKYWHLKTKKRQTQTRNPYLKEDDPSHLILFSVKDQNQKKRQTLTNERARWYKIGYRFFFLLNPTYLISPCKRRALFSRKIFPRLVLQLSTYCDGKKMNKKTKRKIVF